MILSAIRFLEEYVLAALAKYDTLNKLFICNCVCTPIERNRLPMSAIISPYCRGQV